MRLVTFRRRNPDREPLLDCLTRASQPLGDLFPSRAVVARPSDLEREQLIREIGHAAGGCDSVESCVQRTPSGQSLSSVNEGYMKPQSLVERSTTGRKVIVVADDSAD